MKYKNSLKIIKTQKIIQTDSKKTIMFPNGDEISITMLPVEETYGKNEKELFTRLWYQGFDGYLDQANLKQWFDKKCIEWNVYNIWK